MYLFFDTETNGLPQYGRWPRITQLAYKLTDELGNQIKTFNSVIAPRLNSRGTPEWTVPKEQFFIDNNISTERCIAEGVSLESALEQFNDDVLKYGPIYKIAHNLNFDKNVLVNEFRRERITDKHFRSMKEFCTMLSTVDYCRIPGKYGKSKWPRLVELHYILFASDFEGAHDAMFDVNAMEKCFFRLLDLQLIKLK